MIGEGRPASRLHVIRYIIASVNAVPEPMVIKVAPLIKFEVLGSFQKGVT